MTIKNRLTTVLLLTLPALLFAQDVLIRQEAAMITLENNYGVKIAWNDVRVAEKNTSREMNGYLPTVNASIGPTASYGGTVQKFRSASFGEVKVTNAFSWGANGSINANYNLFDKSRDYTLEQMKEVLNLTDLQLRQTMENSLMQVYNYYYQVAKLAENLNVVSQTLEVSRKRLKRAEYRYEYGQGPRIDILNARVDIQRDSINFLNVRQQLANAKRDLNVVMGVPVSNAFAVDTTVVYATSLAVEQLVTDAKNDNIAMLMIRQNRAITEMDLQIINASRKPTVGASAGYSYNFTDNPAGSFIESSTTRGLNAGLTANWNIFNGGRRKVQEQNTRISLESLLLQKEQIGQELERDVRNAWENYQNALFVLEVERNALFVNQLNLERTQELYNNGQVSSVEFRQAQLNRLNAATSFNNAKYDAKMIELQLLQLSGQLLNETN